MKQELQSTCIAASELWRKPSLQGYALWVHSFFDLILFYFVKIIWCSCWLCTPPPILRLNIAYFAVAEGWLLLDIGWFVLFLILFWNLIWPHSSMFYNTCMRMWFILLGLLDFRILNVDVTPQRTMKLTNSCSIKPEILRILRHDSLETNLLKNYYWK